MDEFDIIIKPKLQSIRITVAKNRTVLKFRNGDERDKYLNKCKLFVNEVIKLNCEFTLRGRYYPEKEDDTIMFITNNNQMFIIKL